MDLNTRSPSPNKYMWRHGINNMSTDSSTEASGSKVSMEPMLELGRSRNCTGLSLCD
uniref:Uncharacterized protein n=1 Tax=Helianthus annuus TaxID=4232 RepID=A0A251TN01_HELAN